MLWRSSDQSNSVGRWKRRNRPPAAAIGRCLTLTKLYFLNITTVSNMHNSMAIQKIYMSWLLTPGFGGVICCPSPSNRTPWTDAAMEDPGIWLCYVLMASWPTALSMGLMLLDRTLDMALKLAFTFEYGFGIGMTSGGTGTYGAACKKGCSSRSKAKGAEMKYRSYLNSTMSR